MEINLVLLIPMMINSMLPEIKSHFTGALHSLEACQKEAIEDRSYEARAHLLDALYHLKSLEQYFDSLLVERDEVEGDIAILKASVARWPEVSHYKEELTKAEQRLEEIKNQKSV